MSEIGGLGQHRTHLEKPRRRVSQNAGVHLPRRTELAGSLHRRVRVDSADGNHERHVLGHGLAEDAANGASKRENRKEKRVKCEERLAGKTMTKLQAKHEEHRNSRGAVEVGKNKQEKASIEGYICVLMKSNTKRCRKVEWRFGSRSSPDKGKPQELFRQAPPRYLRPTPVKMPTRPPTSTHDTRVDCLCRRLKLALKHLQKESDLHMLVDLFDDSRCSRNVRDYVVGVVELSQR